MAAKKTDILQVAVGCLERNDREGFKEALARAKAACAGDERLEGEILLLSVVSGVVASDDMLETLLRAEQMIGGSSSILTPQSRFAENHYDAFLLWDSRPGKADAMLGRCEHIDRITEVYQRLTGFGEGISICFRAQRAYARGEMDEALRWAKVDISKGHNGQSSLISVYLLEIQANVAKHTMNQKLWNESYGRLKDIASGQQPASRTCREQAVVVCTMLDMSLGCLHDVPAWARVGDFGVIPAPHGYEIVSDRLLVSTLPSAMIAHMQYLSYSGEPIRSLQTAALIERLLGNCGVVLRAYAELIKAGCYFDLGKTEYAEKAIHEAMKLIVPDRLWLVAAEFVPAFGETLYAIAREYDEQALEKIRSIGEDYWNKLTPLRNDRLRGSTEGLTKREEEVMNLAMKGHSNTEIAEKLNVSVRTVKFHLSNVYQKLNITRRSKFVSDIEQDGVARLAKWVK